MRSCKSCSHWQFCYPLKEYCLILDRYDNAEGCIHYADKELVENLLRKIPKNVRPEEIKPVIVKNFDEFQADVRKAIHDRAHAFVGFNKVEFFDDIGFRSWYESVSRLSDYYGVEIVSISLDDRSDEKKFVIEYK